MSMATKHGAVFRTGRQTAPPGARFWQAFWLVASLLITQQLGLLHRIQHASPSVPAQAAAEALHGAVSSPMKTVVAVAVVTGATAGADAAASPGQPLSHPASADHHSCVLLDGALIGDMHCAGSLVTALDHASPPAPASVHQRWPDLPVDPAFHSRAPPCPAAPVVLA